MTEHWIGTARPVARMAPTGALTTTIYGVAGCVAATQNALGYLTTTLFDGFGRATGSLDPGGYRTTTTLDLLGEKNHEKRALPHF